jgi:hypothetical protein
MSPQDNLAVTQALHEIETALAPLTQAARPRPHVQAVPKEEPHPEPTITDRLAKLELVLGMIYGRIDAIEARLDAKLAELAGRLG